MNKPARKFFCYALPSNCSVYGFRREAGSKNDLFEIERQTEQKNVFISNFEHVQHTYLTFLFLPATCILLLESNSRNEIVEIYMCPSYFDSL